MNARISRPAPLETQSPEGKKIVRFDPTFSTGTIATIITILSSAGGIYTGMKTDMVQQKAEVDSVKAVAVIERAQTQAALVELKESTKELQKSMNEIKQDLAVLRGRASADNGGRK